MVRLRPGAISYNILQYFNNTKRPKNPKRAESQRRFEFGGFGRFFVCFATGPSCTYAPGLTPHRKGFALAVSPPLLILISPCLCILFTTRHAPCSLACRARSAARTSRALRERMGARALPPALCACSANSVLASTARSVLLFPGAPPHAQHVRAHRSACDSKRGPTLLATPAYYI